MPPKFEKLGKEQFEKLYSNRDYNLIAPSSRELVKESFEHCFFELLTAIEQVAESHELNGQFYLHEAHNWSYFVDMAFETDAYLNAEFVREVWEVICVQPDDWMVCIWGCSYLFLTRTRILVYELGEDFEDIDRLEEDLRK